MSFEIHTSRRALLRSAVIGTVAVSVTGWRAALASNGSTGPVSRVRPADASARQRGGTFRVGMVGGGATDTLDPNVLISLPDYYRAALLYGGIVARDTDFNLINRIAEELTPQDAKGQVWDLRLRDGAEFHHGKTITADDVIASLQRLYDPDNSGFGAGKLPELDPGQLEKMDDRTVRIPLTSPVSIMPELIAGALFYVVPADFDPANPVGAGPFKYESFTPGDRSMFTRFDNFWGDVPLLDGVEIINLSDATALTNALLADQVDAIIQIPASQLAQVESAGFQIITTPAIRFSPFYMRLDTAPFDDARVREAFRLIVDREQMVQQVFSGRGSVGNDIYGLNDPSYAADIAQREQDIDRAMALLAEAEYENLEVELVTGDAVGGWPEAAQVFAEQAKAAGVTINVRSVDADTLFSQYYGQAAFGQESFPNWAYMDIASQATQANSPYNTTAFNDEEYNALYAEALQTVDETARGDLIRQMQQIEHERGGYIVWGWEDAHDAVAPSVQGLQSGTKSTGSLNNFGLEHVFFA